MNTEAKHNNPFFTTLRAFNNNAGLKAKLLAEVEAHRMADALARGFYEENHDNAVGFRGCAVGCTLHSAQRLGVLDNHAYLGSHALYEAFGVPRTLARLEDRLFEGMPAKDAQEWPGLFLASIPVGADLSEVVPRFFIWLLADEAEGVVQFARTDAQREAIQGAAVLYQHALTNETVTQDQWTTASAAAYASAASAAAAAAAAAAYAATASTTAAAAAAAAAAATAAAAAYAATASTASTAAAAAAAASAAAYAATASTTREQFYLRMANKLTELMALAPVTGEAA